MIFSSAEYQFFLVIVFLLYFGLRLGRLPGALARLALLLLWGDVVYLLFSHNLYALWDPIGALLFRQIAQNPPDLRTPLEYVFGLLVFGASVFSGWRGERWLQSAHGQRRIAFVSTLALVALGCFIAYFAWVGAIERLGDFFSETGHLIYLFWLGLGFGVSLHEEGRPLGRIILLFLVSAVFYHAWSAGMPGAYQFLLLIVLGTIILDYYLALWIYESDDPGKRKLFLVISLVSNLGILAVFKYLDFFTQSLASLLGAVGYEVSWEPFGLILPAGISFHTFQSLSYTLDVYKRQIPPTRSVMEFATYVLLFPQLIAGPIVRAHEFLPQLEKLPRLHDERAAEGVFRVLVGLLKKVALADFLANNLVDRVFAQPHLFSGVEVLFAVYGYAFQIYLDFSAYSDIAIGSAQILGFTFPENFRTPYRSGDLQEFWRRWHITLSSWLRDYLYIPLGGSKGSSFLTYRNLIITMLLGGLWHGANWTFIVWGALHGGGLAVTRVWQRMYQESPAKVRRITWPLLGVAGGFGALHLWVFSSLLDQASAALGLDPAWLHLIFAWLYLTPLWALLTAWLSGVKPPKFSSEERAGGGGFVFPGAGGVLLALSGVGLWWIGYQNGSLGLEIGAMYGLIVVAIFSLAAREEAGASLEGFSLRALTRFLCQKRHAAPLRIAFLGLSLILLRLLGEIPLWAWSGLLLLWLLLALLSAAADRALGEEAVFAYLRWAGRRALAIVLTFHYVCFAWVFFRAPSFSLAREILTQIGTMSTDAVNLSEPFLCALIVGLSAHFFPDGTFRWLKERFMALPPWGMAGVALAVAALLKHLANPNVVPFIYFQF